METESQIMSHGIQTSDLSRVLPVLDHELWKQDDIYQNSLHPSKHLVILNSKAESGGKIMDLKPKNKATLEN